MFWFGEPWPSSELRASICEEDKYRIETPVGELCLLCGEAIETWAQGIQYGFIVDGTTSNPAASLGPYAHIECQFRSVVGNLDHWQGHCHYVGECNDKSTKSYREEAIEIWKEICLD